MAGTRFATHEGGNQSPSFQDLNLFLTDAALQQAVRREGAAASHEALAACGAAAGSAEAFELGRLANDNPPKLRRFDQKGFPLDLIEFHPAYHEVMRRSCRAGLHCSAWEHLQAPEAPPPEGAQVARLARLYMTTQTEPGHLCPLTMTHAAVPALLRQPEIAALLLPKMLSRPYDPHFRPLGDQAGITLGMGMTEKQGGPDVRANTHRAQPPASAAPGAAPTPARHPSCP